MSSLWMSQAFSSAWPGTGLPKTSVWRSSHGTTTSRPPITTGTKVVAAERRRRPPGLLTGGDGDHDHERDGQPDGLLPRQVGGSEQHPQTEAGQRPALH